MLDEFSVRINSCGINDCPPEWCWKTLPGGFDDYDLWAVFQGVGRLVVGNAEFEAEAGSCFILPPNTQIIGNHDPKRPFFVINVHFSLIKDGKAFFPIPFCSCYVASQVFFKELLSRVISFHYRGSESASVAALKVALNEFLMSVNSGKESMIPHSNMSCIEDMCSCINASPKESCSLSAFAEKYGYSATYLGKLFHKVTGITFSQYLRNARMNQAKVLLRTSSLSVSDISENLGFCDSGHFIKQFKQYTGESPLVYRKKK